MTNGERERLIARIDKGQMTVDDYENLIPELKRLDVLDRALRKIDEQQCGHQCAPIAKLALGESK